MNMSAFARDIAARLHHRGCLIERGHADVAADLRDMSTANMADVRANFDARKLEILAGYGFGPVEQSKPFAYADGVAIIPIHGLLINRMSWSYSSATGYNFIRSQMNAALDDDDVKLIVFDINSYGGLASGCSELAKEIYDSRNTKPSLSVVDARCYSAAYFLGCAATRIVVTPSGGVGSIGVVAMHVDFSSMLENEGVKITFIFDGAEKVDGNQYEPLSKRAKDSIQRDVSYHYGLFVEAVARQRGISEDDVRATEARCYLPPEALELGLIDGVETPIEAVAEFFNELTSDSEAEGDDIMDKTQNSGTSANVATMSATAPPALTAEDVARIAAKAATDAVAADRARAAGIRTCEEAKGREQLADHLALNTNMSIDEAKAILSASPKAADAKTVSERQQPSGFAAAMDRTENPNIGADPETGAALPGAPADPVATAGRLLGNYAAATGRKVIQIGQNRAA
jgi:signal peptide peptidase SppA